MHLKKHFQTISGHFCREFEKVEKKVFQKLKKTPKFFSNIEFFFKTIDGALKKTLIGVFSKFQKKKKGDKNTKGKSDKNTNGKLIFVNNQLTFRQA